MSDWLSRVQLQMLVLLSDGRPHSRDELRKCLADELGSLSNIRYHINRIRQHLPPHRYVACEYDGPTICYRMGRLIDTPPAKGRRRRTG